MTLRKPTAKEQRFWYRKLQAAGFQDAEEIRDGEYVLKQAAEAPYRGTDDITREAKAAYYRLLAQHCFEAQFRNETDRLILTMFADGAKIKAIMTSLETRGTRRARHSIRFIIRKYEMEWGLREYTARQLNKPKLGNRMLASFWRWSGKGRRPSKRFKRYGKAPLDRLFREGR